MNIRNELVLFFLLIIFQITTSSQKFDYKLRNNRYEGVKSVDVSAPDLELLSFVAYREEIPPGSDVNLTVKFFMSSDTTLYITAKELIPKRYYLMKPLIKNWEKGWQQFSPWPTSEVIIPLNINLEQLGVVGRLFSERIGSGHIAPLVIFHSEFKSPIEKYHLYLISKETLSRLNYYLYRTDDRQPFESEKVRKTFFSKTPIPIVIDMTTQSEGMYRLFIKSRVKGRPDGPKRTYFFYHKRIIE